MHLELPFLVMILIFLLLLNLLFLINDLLEVRTDPIKIAMYQRPLPETKRDLGEWERCLWFQLYVAVPQVC